ncbi:cation/calcium exchanger 1-like [Cornus florida]|uniref:cation/calcium exchanger 1-like n=1 Tax=Cornus florida TaxID=4283 RepID=UPI0028A17C6D|nr:cation/calcium exchanger 1-like [Cornus florida]
MAGFQSMHRDKCLSLFLNICFLFLLSCLTTHLCSSNSDSINQFKASNLIAILNHNQIPDDDIGCKALHNHHDHQEKCSYVKTHNRCQPTGYIPYLHLFYCTFSPLLGHTLFILWLILLFYLLGDTAANYFCSSLEGLSMVLNLSPTIAGVTLLSLGNGAPDLFAGVASFMGDGTKDVGLNSILGGVFFVSTIVVGVISLCVHGKTIDKSSFIRDVLFFLLSLSCLLVIIGLGEINLWGAICFLSLYFIYVLFVSVSEMCAKREKEEEVNDGCHVLPLTSNFLEESELGVPLLGCLDDEKPILVDQENSGIRCFDLKSSTVSLIGTLLDILELPLLLPRRLTIPVISEERWSKPFAVISVTIAPLLLAFIWDSHGSRPSLMVYAIGGVVGVIIGVLAFFTTERSGPPRKCLLCWLGGGFLMSITWTYFLAQELISLLVSFGLILGISPSILGLTILAWGNSLGDLVANVTMAKNGGPGGAQIAISGCYAGPTFNTLVGLGLSLAFSAWSVYPFNYVIPRDPFVYETMGFLVAGLLWALVILPKNNMRLDRFLGCGLLVIYLCFLSLKLARTLGVVQLKVSPSCFKP